VFPFDHLIRFRKTSFFLRVSSNFSPKKKKSASPTISFLILDSVSSHSLLEQEKIFLSGEPEISLRQGFPRSGRQSSRPSMVLSFSQDIRRSFFEWCVVKIRNLPDLRCPPSIHCPSLPFPPVIISGPFNLGKGAGKGSSFAVLRPAFFPLPIRKGKGCFSFLFPVYHRCDPFMK